MEKVNGDGDEGEVRREKGRERERNGVFRKKGTDGSEAVRG